MITKIFLSPGYIQTLLATLLKNHFPTTFCGHLEFLHKKILIRNLFWKRSERECDFEEIFEPQGICSLLASFHQNHFLDTFVGCFEFLCVMQKHIYLRNRQRARAILMKFLTHRVSAET